MSSAAMLTALVVVLGGGRLVTAGESSLWCHGSDHQDHRHCSFQNLCYSKHASQFLFFHSESSYLSGLDHPDEQRNVARLAAGNSGLYFNYVSMPVSAFQDYKITRVDEPVLVLGRARSDDISAVVVDDLMSIYFTMKHVCFGDAWDCFKKYQLFLVDDRSESARQHHYLYQMFFEKPVLHARSSADVDADLEADRLTCFSRALVGTDRPSLTEPSGGSSATMRRAHLEEFRRAVGRKLAHIHSRFGLDYPDVLMVSRTRTAQQVINLDEVQSVAEEEFKKKYGRSNFTFSALNFEQHSEEHIFRTAQKAKVLMGPHGSHMVTSIFLSPDGGVLELFPYGLGPDAFGFTKYISELRGIPYAHWINRDETRTFGFPHRSPAEGGLDHLDQDVQEAIKAMKEVTDVGLDDPAYLYRLNQNTKVDVGAFNDTFRRLINDIEDEDRKKRDQGPQDVSDWVIPSGVHSVSCKIQNLPQEGGGKSKMQVRIDWHPPLNLERLGVGGVGEVKYEVMVESELSEFSGSELVSEASTGETHLVVDSVNFRRARYLKVWITAAATGANVGRGVETFFRCDLDQDPGMR